MQINTNKDTSLAARPRASARPARLVPRELLLRHPRHGFGWLTTQRYLRNESRSWPFQGWCMMVVLITRPSSLNGNTILETQINSKTYIGNLSRKTAPETLTTSNPTSLLWSVGKAAAWARLSTHATRSRDHRRMTRSFGIGQSIT